MKVKRVFLVWRPWLGLFAIALARRMKADGMEVYLYVSRAADVASVEAKVGREHFARIIPFQLLYMRACQPVASSETEISRALKHEDWLGVRYAKVAVGDRHFGRGYALGGALFPTSAQSRASRVQILAAYSDQIEFWRREMIEHRPDLVLDGDYLLSTIAAKCSVPFRLTAASRHRNFYYFADNAHMEIARLQPAWLALSCAGREVVVQDVQAATTIDSYWKTAMVEATWLQLFKSVAYQVYKRGRMISKGMPMAPGYDLTSDIAYIYRRRRQLVRMTGPSMAQLADLGDKRVVFFPLATEPEMTLQGLSPEYFFQLEAIAAIARSLPADTVLAVKEHHPGCGARADVFYDQIESFKNVVMLDLRERGVDVIRRADVTVTIAGSAGFEAAAMGKPVIVLGRHNIFDFLPHVRTVKDIAEMDAAIADALDGVLAAPSALADGARFLAAVEAVSFDMDAFDPFSPKSTMEDGATEAAYHSLLDSLPISTDKAATAHA